MPLRYETVGLDFTKGQDTRADPRLIVRGKLTKAQNVTLSKNNALTKPDGYSNIVATADAKPVGVAAFKSELLVIGSDSTVSSVASSDATFARGGMVSPFELHKNQIRRNSGYQAEIDASTITVSGVGQLTCYVWRDWSLASSGSICNGIFCSVVDEASGTFLIDAQKVTSSAATGVGPRVVGIPAAVANASDRACFLIFWDDGGSLFCVPIDLTTTTPTMGARATMQTDTNGAYFDAAYDSGNALVYYVSTDVTNSTFALHVFNSGGIPTNQNKTAVTTQAAYAFAAAGGVGLGVFGIGKLAPLLVVNAGATTGINSAILTTSANTIVVSVVMTVQDAAFGAGTTARVTGTPTGSSNLAIYAGDVLGWAAAPQTTIRRLVISSNNVIQTAAYNFAQVNNATALVINAPRGPQIAGKAFTVNGKSFLPVFIAGLNAGQTINQQNTWFVLAETSVAGAPVIAATALQGIFGVSGTPLATAPISTVPPSVSTLADGSISIPAGEKGALSFATYGTAAPQTIQISSVGLSRLKLTPSLPPTGQPPMRAELGGNLFFSGALLAAYDGHQVTEAGFLIYPEGVALTRVVGGGVMTGAGNYQVRVVYEFVDGQGQRHQSAPSEAVTITTIIAGDRLDVTMPSLQMTMRGVNLVNIGIFCTTANGQIFARVNGPEAVVANNYAAGSVTYRINATDATILAGEPLYTTGGGLANVAPPPCRVLAVHQGRLWMAGLEDDAGVEFSQPSVTGFGVQFSDLLSGSLPVDAGGGTGLVSLDDKLIIFSKRRPFVVTGSGPGLTGTPPGYSPPDEIASDTGCVEPRSVLKTPVGVIFKGKKGWHLLGRGLDVSYIGEGAEAYNANDVKAAVMLEDRKEARFYSSSGVQLYFSYLVGQWSIRAFSEDAVGAQDAVWWPAVDAVVWLNYGGGLVEQDRAAGVYADGVAGTAITIIDTGWLKLSEALDGFQRVKRLLLAGGFIGRSSLVVRQYVNYDSTIAGTATIADTAALKSGAAGDSWEFRWQLPVQKCSAVRFEIQDTPLDPTFGGLNFSGMTLRVGLKKGTAKLAAGQSV